MNVVVLVKQSGGDINILNIHTDWRVKQNQSCCMLCAFCTVDSN